jgi:hypothetical protein
MQHDKYVWFAASIFVTRMLQNLSLPKVALCCTAQHVIDGHGEREGV